MGFIQELMLKISGDSSEGRKAVEDVKGSVEGLGETLKNAFENPIAAVEKLASVAGKELTNALSGLGSVGAGAAVGLTAVAAAAVAGSAILFELTKKAANAGEEVEKFSIKTGVAVQNVGPLQFAVKAAGGSLDELDGVMRRMDMRAMNDQSGKFAESLKSMKINADGFKKLDFEQKVMALGEGFRYAAAHGSTSQQALALFGRSGAEAVPMLTKLTPELMELGKQMGIIWTPEKIAQAKEFNTDLRIFETAVGDIATRVGISLLPVMSQLMDQFIKAPESMNTIVEITKDMIIAMSYLGQAVVGVAKVFSEMLKAVKSIALEIPLLIVGLAEKLSNILVTAGAAGSKVGIFSDTDIARMKDAQVVLAAMSKSLQKEQADAHAGAEGNDKLGQTLSGLSAGFASVRTAVEHLDGKVKNLGSTFENNARDIAKTEKITEQSIAKTEALWEQYYQLLATLAGDDLSAKISAIDRWEEQQRASLDKTRKWNENYDAQLLALQSVADEKRLVAQKDYFDKDLDQIKQFREESVKAAQSILLGPQTVVRDLGVAIGSVQMITGKFVDQSLTQIADQSLVAAQNMRELKNQVLSFGSVAKEVVGGFPKLLQDSFTGGGGFSGALQAFGSSTGSSLFGESGPLGFGAGGLMNGIGNSLTKKLGTTFGQILPGLGGVVGSLIGPLLGKLFNIGGPSQQELQGRDVEGKFESSFGGFSQMMAAVGAAYAATGKSAQQAQSDVAGLLAAEKQGGDAAQVWIDKINGAFNDQKQDAADLDSAIQKYGFSIEELGPKLQKQKLDEQAQQLINDWRVLVQGGIDVTKVDEKMASSVQDYLNTAIKTGAEVPVAMQPILEKMIAAGELTDENGNKLNTLADLHVSWSETMTEGFQKVVDKLTELIQKIGGDLPAALLKIPKTVDIGVNLDINGATTTPIPSFANRPMEQVTSAGYAKLHPGDYVGVPTGSGALGGRGVHIVVQGNIWSTNDLVDELHDRLSQIQRDRYPQRAG